MGRRPLWFIYGPNLTKNTSRKIENFDKTVLASGDVSEFEKNTKKKYYAQVLSFRANSQWKKRLKCADLILKNYDKKKTFLKKWTYVALDFEQEMATAASSS